MRPIIKLAYRKLITSVSPASWDRLVFEATYREYKLQVQQFDQQKLYETFSAFRDSAQRRAEEMQYLVSTSIAGYLQQLECRMPDVTNALGRLCIQFKNFTFEIVQSDLKSRDSHAVVITFYSEPLRWVDSIGANLILSSPADDLASGAHVDTVMMIPNLSIVHYSVD